MWRKDLEKMLLSVNECNPLKYLPNKEVDNLQLQILGCRADVILIRKEYNFTVEMLNNIRREQTGMLVTGQPGIGMS